MAKSVLNTLDPPHPWLRAVNRDNLTPGDLIWGPIRHTDAGGQYAWDSVDHTKKKFWTYMGSGQVTAPFGEVATLHSSHLAFWVYAPFPTHNEHGEICP